MSIDEQVAEYMDGWADGVSDTVRGSPTEMLEPEKTYQRGFNAGRAAYLAAYLAAERAERERLEAEGKCEACLGSGKQRPRFKGLDCEVCHGTGRRP